MAMYFEEFFDVKATEAGFDLNDESDRQFISSLCHVVEVSIHGEEIPLRIKHAGMEVVNDNWFSYDPEEECFIGYGVEWDISLNVAYLVNLFGLELVYRKGEHRIYIKK